MPTTIDALPTPPSRQDPTNFAARGDAFMAALPTMAAQMNAAAAEVEESAAICASAAQTANVTAWASGTTYAVGANVFDPVTLLTYRRKVAGAGTTRPALDGANWQLLTGFGTVDQVSAQTIDGAKTFTQPIVGSITGSASSASSAGTSSKLGTANWTVEQVDNSLVFKYGTTAVAKLDSNGAFTSANNVTAFGVV